MDVEFGIGPQSDGMHTPDSESLSPRVVSGEGSDAAKRRPGGFALAQGTLLAH